MTGRQDALERIAEWADIALPTDALEQLTVFSDWLAHEAIPAGGVGPNEESRLWNRHILDSALFAGFVEAGDSVLDIGSGVGLPGIPLAIMRPDCVVTLLDRAGRRSQLARRAVRVVGLDNIVVVQGDIASYAGRHSVAVSRGSLPPERLLQALSTVDGLRKVVAAGSHSMAPMSVPGWDIVEIPQGVAGERIWFLEAWLSSPEEG